VLTYRQPAEVLADCVCSVGRSGDADLIVVVDNGATVEVDPLVAAAGCPVALLRPGSNLGFAGGMNRGLEHALADGATAVAVLNDDTVVTDGWLKALAARLDDDPNLGAVQPKLLLMGPPPERLNSVGVRWRGDGAGIDIGFGEVDRGQYDEVRSIELFTAGAVLLRRELLEETGGFDERYFLYYEDVDLALRGSELGWHYGFEPASVVHHRVGATVSRDPEERRYWQERNRLWCLARHAPISGVSRGLVRSAARLARHPTRAQLRAVVDGLAAMPRQRRERAAAAARR